MDDNVYKEIESELCDKYKEYTGDDTDITYSFYSDEQLIEHYSRKLAFWSNELNQMNDQSDKKTEIKKEYITKVRANIINAIEKDFTNIIKSKIMNRVSELLDEKHQIIDNIRKELKEKHQHATQLYDLAVKHMTPNTKFSPIEWLKNQSEMRKSWEKTLKGYQLIGDIGIKMLDNPFSKYMNYMYNAYPPLYSERIEEEIKTKGYCDSAQIYYELISKNNN